MALDREGIGSGLWSGGDGRKGKVEEMGGRGWFVGVWRWYLAVRWYGMLV